MKLDLGALELGVATAATQIEGGDADTNWHRWAATPGHIKDGSTPARAADHWNRVDEDIALLSELGIRHYRMGLEWARLEPVEGVFDRGALAHYRDELRALRAAGIAPLVTLHHFNNPGWLEQRGAWLDDGTPAAFIKYVAFVVEALKDLVDEWITINEPNVYATQAHAFGDWPPGHRSVLEAMTVMSRLADAHIRAYQTIHAIQPAARVGVANHLRVFDPANLYMPLDRVAAKTYDHLFQGAIMDAMAYGRFRLPLKAPADVRPGRYYDFTGLNYYSRSLVRGFAQGVKVGVPVPVNDLGWDIFPAGLFRLLRRLASRYPGDIYVTENGTADAADAFRARYIYQHLLAVVRSGAPVKRYYHWCFTDNWEWIEGEVPRFGLVQLDYATQTRTVRPSGRFFADVIAHHGVTERAHAKWVEPSGAGSTIG